MAFEFILANLIADVDDAVGALFLDPSGETVDLACADRSPYELKVIGAYLGIYLRHLDKVMRLNHLGEPRMVHIEKRQVHIHAEPLPDGYYLVLVQKNPGKVTEARLRLSLAAEQLKGELFLA